MKTLSSWIALAVILLAVPVRADIVHPEGELQVCELPGITVPSERSSYTPIIATAAERVRPAC